MQRSYLKWAGGKYNALSHILPVISSYGATTLIEPFFGSGTISLNTNFESYLLSDLNGDLVVTHNMVTNHLERVIDRVTELFEIGISEYMALRKQFNELPKDGTDDLERASLFIYLNKHAFNGLCRYNKSGGFNVASAEKTKKPAVPLNEMNIFRDKGFEVKNLNYADAFKLADSMDNSVIYCDPPYIPMAASNFNYTNSGFGYDEHVELLNYAMNSKHTTIISNHYNEVTIDLYRDADEILTFPVNRSISRDSGSRVPVMECLVIYKGDNNE